MTNPAKKPTTKPCAQCGKEFEPWNSLDTVCGVKCAVDLAAKKARSKKRERIEAKKQFNKERKAFRDNDRPRQVKLTQAVFNRFIVQVQEAGKPCYTCGRDLTGKIKHCGHFLSRGAHPEKARDERNCRVQCPNCNTYHSGRPDVFEKNLRAELGDAEVDDLISYKPEKATCADLIELRKHYSRLLREAGI